MSIITKIFGTKNERELSSLTPHLQAINSLESKIKKYSNSALSRRILEIKTIITQKIDNIKSNNKNKINKDTVNIILDCYLHEVFAIVREAARRVLNMRHFNVQILGGIVLNNGNIAEMKTGEGKTLVATLPSVLNCLTDTGVHIVTVNEYLASRDAEWMGRIYRFLGLSVGVIVSKSSEEEKKTAYNADITYGQNNEFGFDYLRDNMKFSLNDYVQRGHNFAIIDEVDSILIDEARTPLIISESSKDDTHKYSEIGMMIKELRNNIDFSIDEKSKMVMLTEAGIKKSELLLKIKNLYDPSNIELLHHLNQALRSFVLFQRDVDYVIENGTVVIVDEHTGRLMHGRRWSDGLHQAIEAKEKVNIQPENQTLATITFQNLFRMYKKLSGMTGTADTEAEEFSKIYNLNVIVIPTNNSLIRSDENDLIYKLEIEKVKAIINDIIQSNKKGQPILVGTVSVEKSEILSKRLKKYSIIHHVLNAKRHHDEASIIAQAGRLNAVTITTNMAGRGTDIILGGDPEFMARVKVINKYSNSRIQNFNFLTGKPNLINVDLLALRDLIELKHFLKIANKFDKKINIYNDVSEKNINKSYDDIYTKQKKFYTKIVRIYTDELEKASYICKLERQKVLTLGGLRVIGTERHESRRIDNQLRGRSGRQGDPGSSLFYLSLQDDLMRIFGSDKMISVMEKLGMKEDQPIEHRFVSKSIATAQKRVENFYFDARKQLIDYDDVMNQQRNAVYNLRRKVLKSNKIDSLIFDLVEQFIVSLVIITPSKQFSSGNFNLAQIQDEIFCLFGIYIDLSNFIGDRDDLMDLIFSDIEKFYLLKQSKNSNEIDRFLYLQTIDFKWKEHLHAMEYLRDGIHFRGYANKDPKQEYKIEGYNVFVNMMSNIRDEVLEKVFKKNNHTNLKSKFDKNIKYIKKNNKHFYSKNNNQNISIDNKRNDDIKTFNRHQRRKINAYRKNKNRKKTIR